jgi:hypothetical protein
MNGGNGMIKSNSAIRFLQYALCLCVFPQLLAQQASQPSLLEVRLALPSAQGESKASDTIVSRPISLQAPNQAVLRLEQPVSSASVHKGDRIRFTALNSFSPDRKVVIPAGATLHSTVTYVRPKTAYRSGDFKFSDPEFVIGNGQRIRLTTNHGDELIGPGAIPVIVVGAVTLGPLVVVTSPIWVTNLLIHDIREQRARSLAHVPKPDPVDKCLSKGQVLNYYTRNDSRIRPDRTANPAPSQPAGPPLQSGPTIP